MALTEIVKQAKDAGGGLFNLVFQDKNGDGAQLAQIHAVRNSQGATINPATDDNLTSIAGTAISTASLATGGAGIFGWLSSIYAAAVASTTAGENHIGEVGGNYAVAAASFIRPADTNAYVLGDLVANSTTAASVVPLQLSVARKQAGTGKIARVRLTKTGTSITNAMFRVHLYKTLPTPVNGDNGVWLTDKSTDYLGSFDITMDKTYADGAKGFGVPNTGNSIIFDTGATSQVLYALIEARGAYTPVSGETFILAAEAERN